MNHIARLLLSFALIAMAGCQSKGTARLPTGKIYCADGTDVQVSVNVGPAQIGDAASQLPRLEAELRAISAKHGEKSIEMIKANRDTGLLLIDDYERYDLAQPYFEEVLRLSREVLGNDDRETAFALQDLAMVRGNAGSATSLTAIEPLLREAIAVRQRVLGPDHPETAGAEAELSRQLLAEWRRRGTLDPFSSLLVEADQRASHALPVLEELLGVHHQEVTTIRYQQVEIALARHDYSRAGSQAQDLISRYDRPCDFSGKSPGARDLQIAALRGAGHNVEADAAERAKPPDECNILFLEEFLKKNCGLETTK